MCIDYETLSFETSEEEAINSPEGPPHVSRISWVAPGNAMGEKLYTIINRFPELSQQFGTRKIGEYAVYDNAPPYSIYLFPWPISREIFRDSEKLTQDEFIVIAANEMRFCAQPILALSEFLLDKNIEEHKDVLSAIIRHTKRLRVWEVCELSDDLKSDNLDPSKFAVEFFSVLQGNADNLYQHPDLFFRLTNMQLKHRFLFR